MGETSIEWTDVTWLSDGEILRVFQTMSLARSQTFQVLTKRPGRMVEWFKRWADVSSEPAEAQLVRGPAETRRVHPSPRGRMFAEYLETLGGRPPRGYAWPTFDWVGGMRWWPGWSFDLPNVWLGTSVENRATLHRIEVLRAVPRFESEAFRHVRFLSIEPLLEDIGQLDLHGIHWVIVGGESGPGARPCDVAWIRSVVRQCRESEVPCFTKQWGKRPTEGGKPIRLKSPKGGDPEEWGGGDWPREFPRQAPIQGDRARARGGHARW